MRRQVIDRADQASVRVPGEGGGGCDLHLLTYVRFANAKTCQLLSERLWESLKQRLRGSEANEHAQQGLLVDE